MPSVTFNFTSASIHKHLTSTANNVILRDSTLLGLIIRRTGDGKARFAVEKRFDGRLFKSVLWPLSENQRIDEARAKASEIFLSLRDGINPRRTANLNSLNARTVDDWLDLHKSTVRLSTHKQNLCAIRQMKVGSKRLLTDFESADGFTVFDTLRNGGTSESTSRRYISVLRLLWAFAAERADIEARNPFDKVMRGLKTAPARQQYVALSDLPKLIDAIRLRGGTGGAAAEFLTITGLRLNEVLRMEWSEVDIKDQMLTIRAERMKAGLTLRRPLTKRMVEILSSRPKGKYVFNSDHAKNTPTSAAPRTVLSWAGAEIGMPALRPHDLRRSYVTAAYSLNVSSAYTQLLVAHSAGSGAHAGYIIRDNDQLRLAAQTIEDGILSGCRTTEQTQATTVGAE